MTEVTQATVASIMNLTVGSGTTDDITATKLENLMDLALDVLNLFGADLPAMSGSAGSKTIGLDSQEKAALLIVVRMIYYSFYKNVQSATVGGVTITAADLLKDSSAVALIEKAAQKLQESENPDSEDLHVLVG